MNHTAVPGTKSYICVHLLWIVVFVLFLFVNKADVCVLVGIPFHDVKYVPVYMCVLQVGRGPRT